MSKQMRRIARSVALPPSSHHGHHHATSLNEATPSTTTENPNNRIFDSSDPRLWKQNENILIVDDIKAPESSPASALYPVSNQLFTTIESDQNTLFAFYNVLNVDPFLFALAAKPAKKVWGGIVSDVIALQQRQDAPKFKILYDMIKVQVFDANICPPTSLPTTLITNIAQSYSAIFNKTNQQFSTQQFAAKLERDQLNCLRIQFDRDDAFFRNHDSKNWAEYLLQDLNEYINKQKGSVLNRDTIFYITTYLPDYVWHACLIDNYGMDSLHLAKEDIRMQLAIRHRTAQDFIREAGLTTVPKIGMLLRQAPQPNKTWQDVNQAQSKTMWTNSWELVVGVKDAADLPPVLAKIASMNGKKGMGLKSEVIKVTPFKYRFTKAESMEKYVMNYCFVCKKHFQSIVRHVCDLAAAQALQTQKDLVEIEPLLRGKNVTEEEIALTRVNYKSDSCNICTGLNANCFHTDKNCDFMDPTFIAEIKSGRHWCNQCEKWTNHMSGELDQCPDFIYFHNARVGRMLYSKVVLFERENKQFIKVCEEKLEMYGMDTKDEAKTQSNTPISQPMSVTKTEDIMNSISADFSALSIQQRKQQQQRKKTGVFIPQQPTHSLPPYTRNCIQNIREKMKQNQKDRYMQLKARYTMEKHAIIGMDGNRFGPKLRFMEANESLASGLNNDLVAAQENEFKSEVLGNMPTPGSATKDVLVKRFNILDSNKPVPYGTHKLHQKIPPYLRGLRSKDLKSLPKHNFGSKTSVPNTSNINNIGMGPVTTTAGLVIEEEEEDIDIKTGQSA